MSKMISSVSRVVNQQALEAISQKLNGNVWAVQTSLNPNANKLLDGAIQRKSVVPDSKALHPSVNTDKVGYYKRPQMDESSSRSGLQHSLVWDGLEGRNMIARIYHPSKKHLHNHPTNKLTGTHWVIEFQSASQFKSPLMNWTSASTDSYGKLRMVVGSLSAAVKTCETMGWGYDVLYPQRRWHTKKNYSDNFAWKGFPTSEQSYD